MTTNRHLILILVLIIITIATYSVRGVHQGESASRQSTLHCTLPMSDLKGYVGNSVVELGNLNAIPRLSGSNLWLGYGVYSQYVDDDGKASEGFNWTTDHELALTIQGRQKPSATGWREIGQVEIYTSESVPDVYWILGYNNLRLFADANGEHYSFHPCVAFETTQLYGLYEGFD